MSKKNREIHQEAFWSCPEVGSLKMNADAALDSKIGCAGLGFVIRNHEGKIKAAGLERLDY